MFTYHFIFGMTENFNQKPFQYFHHLCLKSCYLTQNAPTIIIHYIHEPVNNVWWDKTKEFCQVVKYNTLPDIVYFCNNKNVSLIEHQSDIFRLLILKEHGGVYADIDTLFYKPFFPHFSNKKFVMGKETLYHISWDKEDINGLCNALIISDKNAPFLDLWLEEYKTGYDNHDWNKMSVRKPYELYQKHPELIHVEANYTFHKYNWTTLFYENKGGINSIYTDRMADCGIFSKHMSESKIYDFLITLTAEKLKTDNSLFATMCQNINGLL